MNIPNLGQVITGLVVGVNTFFGGPSPSPTPATPISPDSLERHQTFHYPIPDDLGEEVNPTPYLTLPFKKGQAYDVTQGWIYSQEELNIHHANPIHAAIDFHVPYGTEVYSPVDGYAIASYETAWVREGADYKAQVKSDNEEYKKPIKELEGKPIRLGLGYFIYIYAPSANRFLEFAHLSELDPSLIFSPPKYNPKTDGWDPQNYLISIADMPSSPYVVKVSKGDPLGKVGYSGLTWGYDDYIPDSNKVEVIDPNKYKSWDIPHLHFEEFWIDQETKQKGWQRDPYAIYDTFDHYPTPTRVGLMGKDPLWILGSDNLPEFAK